MKCMDPEKSKQKLVAAREEEHANSGQGLKGRAADLQPLACVIISQMI